MPLPPIGLDTWRRFAADRWKGVTDATISRVQSGLWDMQAEDAISRLRPLDLPEPQPSYEPPEPAYEPPPPPPPPPPPASAPPSPSDALGWGMRSTLSGIGQRASTALSGAQDWASRADAAIDDLGGQLGGAARAALPQVVPDATQPGGERVELGGLTRYAPLPPALEGLRPGLEGYGEDVATAGRFVARRPGEVLRAGRTLSRFTPVRASETALGLATGRTTPGALAAEVGEALPAVGAVGTLVPLPAWQAGNLAANAVEEPLLRAGVSPAVAGAAGLVADVLTPSPGDLPHVAARVPGVVDDLTGLAQGLPSRFRRAAVGATPAEALGILSRSDRSRLGAEQTFRRAETGAGSLVPFRGKKTPGVEHLDSSYEAVVARRLEDNPEVVAWTKRLPDDLRPAFADPDTGETLYAAPDYLVTYRDGSQEVLEVKNAYRAGLPQTKARLDATRAFYDERGVPYSLVTEDEIGRRLLRGFDPARSMPWLSQAQATDLARRLSRVSLTPAPGYVPGEAGAVRSLGAVPARSGGPTPARGVPPPATREDVDALAGYLDEARRRLADPALPPEQRRGLEEAIRVLEEAVERGRDLPAAPAGEGLGAVLGRATEPLGARAAQTPGERAFDVAAGTAGGIGAAATAPEDAPWQERLARGAVGASLGALGGANVRQLGRIGRGALTDEALGVAAGPSRQLGLSEAPEAAALSREARALLTGPRPPDATNWDRLVAWMTSNALSNPRSLTGNALGGVEQTLGRFGRYAGQGRPQDAWRELGAWWASKGDVADATRKALWTGERPPRVGETVGATAETSPQAFSGPKGLVATPASRVAGATDAFFSMLARAGGEAVADARGLTGEARAAFVQEQVQESVLSGTPSVFTRMVGDLKGLINSPDLGDKLKAAAALVYVPFARVPEVIWKQGLYRTASPLTDLPVAGYQAFKGNPQRARNAVQRWATNTAIAGPVLWQVGQGNLTGSGPDDPAKRRELEATGWRPNSVRIGDEWYSYDWLGPLGLQMNALATIAETWAEGGKEPDADAYKKVDKVLNRMGQLAYDEFYLRTFFDLMGAVKDGRMTDSLERTASEAGARLIPYSAAQNWLAGGTDPYEREPETPLERVQARTLLRQGVPARIDPTTGQPQRRGGTPAERLGGFGRPTVEATPLAQEVARLRLAGQDVSVPAFTPGEKHKDVEQTRAQRRVLQQVYGSEVAAATRELLASPDYQQADDTEKARLLRRQITVARSRADVVAGDRVARSPKGKAELAYLAVPHYEGMGRNLSPQDIRLENLRTAEAKQRLADARKKYPGNPDKGETEFLRADREAYRRAERSRVDAETLAARKQAIEKEYGVDLP